MIRMVTIKQQQGGFALLMAILVATVALSIGISLLSITLKQLSLSASVRDSEMAFQLATTGLECAMEIRRENANDVNQGNDLTGVECAEVTIGTMEDEITAQHLQRYEAEFDVSVPTNYSDVDRCVQFEFFIINDQASSRELKFSGQDNIQRNFNRTCVIGDVCTIATARGYNQSCANKNNASLYPIQRELTAEF